MYAATARLSLDSNFTVAAEYLKPITLNQEVPDHIRTYCATLLNRGGGARVALAFLVDRYLKSDNTINREIFITKILKLYSVPPEKEAGREDTLIRILQEMSTQPQIQLLGLRVIHEYLSDNLSPTSKRLIELLYQ